MLKEAVTMDTQKNWAIIIGVILIAIGLFGFFNNPILGLFKVNVLHNLVHLGTGLIFVIASRNMAMQANKTFGVAYIIVGIIGFLGFLTFLNVNGGNDLDNWLHLAIGIISAAIGWESKSAKK